MDLSNLWGILPLVAIVIVVILVQSFLTRKGKPETQRTIVQNVLMDVNINQTILDMITDGQLPKRFSSNNWQLNRHRIDFLTESMQISLSDTFDIVDELNQQIRLARKGKSLQSNYIDMKRLREPLARSRRGLEDWLMANGGPQDGPPIRYPSISDTLFGTGR